MTDEDVMVEVTLKLRRNGAIEMFAERHDSVPGHVRDILIAGMLAQATGFVTKPNIKKPETEQS